MLLSFLAAAALAAAAYLLFRSLRKKFQKEQEQQQQSPIQVPQKKMGNEDGEKSQKSFAEIINDLNGLPDALMSDKAGLEKAIQKLFAEEPHETRELLNKLAQVVNSIDLYDETITLDRTTGFDFNETKYPADRFVVRPVTISELDKMLPSEHGADDETFYAKLSASKNFGRFFEEEKEITEKIDVFQKKALLLLQDVSGSMEGMRIQWSLLLNLLLAKKCRAEKAMFTIIPFDSVIQQSFSADPGSVEEYEQLIQQLRVLLGYGGGTDVGLALDAGIKYLTKDSEKEGMLSAGQILLVTDGTEGVNAQSVLDQLYEQKILLHSVLIGIQHGQLEEISRKFNYVPC
jgi:uncharacterized protein YegL